MLDELLLLRRRAFPLGKLGKRSITPSSVLTRFKSQSPFPCSLNHNSKSPNSKLKKKVKSYLPPPTIPNNTPLLNNPTSFLPNILHKFRNSSRMSFQISIRLPPRNKFIFFFLGIRRIPRNICWVSLEEIWHENLILMILIVCVSENVGALKGLRFESEDVVDYEDGCCCCWGACVVCLVLGLDGEGDGEGITDRLVLRQGRNMCLFLSNRALRLECCSMPSIPS